jgi:CDP-glucose 4,6-dehydratase
METNVMGTLNVLEAASACNSIQAQLVVTTDKVYRNVNRLDGYGEQEPVGGDDPYSASKAMADLLTHSWVTSFTSPPTAIARAGNVIGGGDRSPDRLVPDIVSALAGGRPVRLRNPDAIRPWQHVLDCLAGYQAIIDHLLGTWPQVVQGEPWNIGPDSDSRRTVGEVADRMSELWGGPSGHVRQAGLHPGEAHVLALDSSKARNQLEWTNVLSFDDALAWTVEWELALVGGASALTMTRQQVARHVALLADTGLGPAS